MNIATRWIVVIAASGGAVLASLVPSKRHNKKRAHTGELQEWENEGGGVAEAPDVLVTTGSA